MHFNVVYVVCVFVVLVLVLVHWQSYANVTGALRVLCPRLIRALVCVMEAQLREALLAVWRSVVRSVAAPAAAAAAAGFCSMTRI